MASTRSASVSLKRSKSLSSLKRSTSLSSPGGLYRFIEPGDPGWKPDKEGQECNICAVRIEKQTHVCNTLLQVITPFVPLYSEVLVCSPGGITADFVAQ